MKEFRSKIFIILGAFALSLYLLYPTFADYKNNQKLTEISEQVRKKALKRNPNLTTDQLDKLATAAIDSVRATDPSYKKNREKRVKLGLDLQGGMYIVMEVNTAKMLEKLAKDPDDAFMKSLSYAENVSKVSDEDVVALFTKSLKEKGIRLSRYFGSIRDDDDMIIATLKKQSEDAVTRAIEIIRNRVDQYGVSEPSIQRQGARRIVVELPGVAKEEEAKQLLQGRALLEFKLVKDAEFTIPIMKKIDEVLAGKIISDTTLADTTKKAAATAQAKDTAKKPQKELSKEEFEKQHPFFAVAMINPESPYADAYVREDQRNKLELMLSRPEVKKVIPDNVEFAFSAIPEIVKEGVPIYRLYMVNSKPELTGGVVTNAQANIDPQTTGAIVTMQMNSEGAREWARITGGNINKRCAIVLDGLIYSAPSIRGKIPSGNSQIDGMANLEEAKLLEIVLKAGALPAPVDIIEHRTVGPSLGQDSINKGFTSALVGYILVALFMMFYYQKAGGVAGFSLVFTVLFILAALAGFAGTLTLPGIAGIVLSIGMAVDSNVLIYERIREELGVGKTMKAAISSGFQQSFSAIFDSNVTNLSTGVILYQFGSGPIQGFAVTLMIGIVASLFSSLVITRLIFDYMAEKGYKISIG